MSGFQGCKGTNCGCTDGVSHSVECRAEHDALCYQAEIGDLRAELAAAIKQRDEARENLRDACDEIATRVNASSMLSMNKTAEIVAEERGWDCFKEGGGA